MQKPTTEERQLKVMNYYLQMNNNFEDMEEVCNEIQFKSPSPCFGLNCSADCPIKNATIMREKIKQLISENYNVRT